MTTYNKISGTTEHIINFHKMIINLENTIHIYNCDITPVTKTVPCHHRKAVAQICFKNRNLENIYKIYF